VISPLRIITLSLFDRHSAGSRDFHTGDGDSSRSPVGCYGHAIGLGELGIDKVSQHLQFAAVAEHKRPLLGGGAGIVWRNLRHFIFP
jgi:hypothetical protein